MKRLFASLLLIVGLAYGWTLIPSQTLAKPTEHAGHNHPTPEKTIKKIPAPSADIFQPLPDEAILGNADAPVTILEYASLSCPHCASFHTGVLPTLKKKYIETGKARLINRHYPLNEPALRAAMLVKCVGKDRAHKFTDVLFKIQSQWAFDSQFLDAIRKIASVGGFPPESFDKCVADDKVEQAVLHERHQAAEQLHINSTPSFFINGLPYSGKIEIKEFEKRIEAALAKAEKAKASTPKAPADAPEKP